LKDFGILSRKSNILKELAILNPEPSLQPNFTQFLTHLNGSLHTAAAFGEALKFFISNSLAEANPSSPLSESLKPYIIRPIIEVYLRMQRNSPSDKCFMKFIRLESKRAYKMIASKRKMITLLNETILSYD
jgi:hypothetical protein